MGRILIFSTGSTAYEAGGNCRVSNLAGQIAPPENWAQAALPRIIEEKPVAVYYCQTPDAREYAEIISNQIGMTAQPILGLENEIDPNWKGMSDEDCLMMERPFEHGAPAADELQLPFADNIDNLRGAVASSLDDLARQHKKETVLVVSHRMLTVLVALHLLHMSNKHYRQIAQDFGALNLFEIRSGMPSVIYLNDTCHLHGLILGYPKLKA